MTKATPTMEELYQQNPKIGRVKLQTQAGVPDHEARQFLLAKKYGEPVKAEKHTKEPELDLSPLEIEIIKQGLKVAPIQAQHFEWAKDSFKFVHITDTHMGHKLSKLEWWNKVCDFVEKENIQFACHTGDVTEGMNKRIPGHIYELEAIGSTAQVELAEARFKLFPVPVYAINGNHDLWGYSQIGFDPCNDLQERLPGKFHYLGSHEADLKVGEITIKLWHGEDGASYATSYRSQ